MAGCGGQCTLLIVDCTTAMDISALSFYSNEKGFAAFFLEPAVTFFFCLLSLTESLLAPGTQLKVLRRARKGNIAEIHVTEVGRAFG